jgi:nitrite reductase (NO-forming)
MRRKRHTGGRMSRPAEDAGRRRRVVESHQIARAAFRSAALFAVVAAGWAVWVLFRGGSWWGPLHAFVAGSVLLSISGAAQLFTVTWSSAPAPPAWLTGSQRWAVIVGVGLVLVGASGRWSALVLTGGVLAGVGIVLLAASLIGAVRRSLLRRFDLSARFYVLALACGFVGIGLGVVMGVGAMPARFPTMRLVHVHANLVGLVGFTIVGTLPTILPTFAHHRMVSGREARAAWGLAVASGMLIVGGIVGGERAVGVGSLLAAASLLTITVGVVARLGRKGLDGGLPYLQVLAGCGWLAGWAIVDGARLVMGELLAPFAPLTAVVVAVGVGQVLAGSLAYLVPVLIGPAPLLGRNSERMHARPWLPLTAANVAGVLLLAGVPSLALGLIALWILDFAARLMRLERGLPAA